MNKILEYIADHWVSWLIETAVLSVIAFFTIQEMRETQHLAQAQHDEAAKLNYQTRRMLEKYDEAVTLYVSQKSKAVDETVSKAVNATSSNLKNLTEETKSTYSEAKSLLKSWVNEKSSNENNVESK